MLPFQASATNLRLNTCFAGFYSLSAEDPRARELLHSTYEALLDMPRDEGVRQLLLEAIENGGDPFAAQVDRHDLYFVGKHLNEFRGMLQQLGWDTPENRASLMALVQRRRGGITATEAKLHEAIAGGRRDEQYDFEGAKDAKPVPGGRYFVGRRSGHSPNFEPYVFLYDTQTRTQTTVPGYATGSIHHPVITSDGKRVVVQVGDQLIVHELKDGKLSSPGTVIHPLKWRSRLVGRFRDTNLENVTPLARSNWIVAQLEDTHKLRLYDLDKKAVSTIKGHGPFLKGYKSDERMSWGTVKGENAIVVLTPSKIGTEVQWGTFDATGKATWKTIAKLRPSVNEYQLFSGPVTATSRYVVLKHFPDPGNLTVVDVKDGSIRDLSASHPGAARMNRIFLHPNGREMMGVSYYAVGNYYMVHWTDLETGKTSEIIKTAAGYFDLSPDGESILIRGSMLDQPDSDFIRIVNPRNRLVP